VNDLVAELAEHDFWYHTIEFPGGSRTPGLFDMPRALSRVGMPESLDGKRCLDVGTAEGFWAFEMERRGASEVVAMDLGEWARVDWPPACASVPQGEMDVIPRFKLAHRALASDVEWIAGSVYDLSPETHGKFDFIFLGSLLAHLSDPVRALAAIRSVLEGELLVNDVVSLPLTLLQLRRPAARLAEAQHPVWWIPNVAGLQRLAEAAGYQVLAVGRPYFLPYGRGRATAPQQILTPVSPTPLRRLPLRLVRNLRDRLGIPHAWLLASPRPELASEPPSTTSSANVAAHAESQGPRMAAPNPRPAATASTGISEALERELTGTGWMYPWELAEGVTAPLLGDNLPSVHSTRAEMIEGPVREALAAAGPDATALDLACCEGWFSHRLLEWGAGRVVGVDVRELNIRRAELVREHFGIDRERLSFRRADVFELNPAELGHFDVVLVLGLVYHLEDPTGALRRARAMTRGLCAIESQLTRQTRPIVYGGGSPDVFHRAEASFAAFVETYAAIDPLASVSGVLSLVPNRAALETLARVAGFEEVEFLEPSPHHDVQYLRGDRAVVVGR